MRKVTKVSVSCLSANSSWIFLPQSVGVAVSGDGRKFKEAGQADYEIPKAAEETSVKELSVPLGDLKARYLKVTAKNIGKCPDWHPGAGGKAWMFIDEIIVE